MKRSAGIVVYRNKNGMKEVLLAHPGGPFWDHTDSHAWSIPKGEKKKGERIIDTARREFMEETNLKIDGKLKYLGSKKVSNRKLLIMFYINKDFDLKNCKSNTFKREFEGETREYPEMDDYKYFSIDDAKEKIFNNQIYFIDKLKYLI